MIRWMVLFVLLAAPMTATPTTAAAEPDACAYDKAKMLAMDLHTFDQTAAGWRSMGERKGCEIAGADLIAAYRAAYNDAIAYDAQITILYWHEGQLRAIAGDYPDAIRAMEASRQADSEVWNLYVDGTIAFLHQDRAGLIAARKTMLSLPRPAAYAQFDQERQAKGLGPLAWPTNIKVIEGLIGCFGEPYSVAYFPACRDRFANE
jgi:hypothetical protein